MIYLNLIPKNMWYLNLRKMLSEAQWKLLSTQIRSEQHYTCYCCKKNSNDLPKNKFHAHEAWWFDDQTNTVQLKAIICVCEWCHITIHFGYASISNKAKLAFNHLQKVNQWNYELTKEYIDAEFEIWSQRSKKQWTIDLNSFKNWINEEQFTIVKQYLVKNKIAFNE